MKFIIALGLLLIANTAFSQFDMSAIDKFNHAKRSLARGRLAEAVGFFEELYEKYPNHTNVNYMLGLCYTEKGFLNEKSVELLENATKDINIDYEPNTAEEDHAPIFAWYYLTIAYGQNGQCIAAQGAFNNFHSLYGLSKDDFYVQDSKRWIVDCELEQEKEPEPAPIADAKPIIAKVDPPKTKEPEPVVEPEVPEEPAVPLKKWVYAKDHHDFVTKSVDYTVSTPLYGVQIGTFSRFVPISKFDGLKNVEAFMDKEGTIRYVIGHFSRKKEAENLLAMVMGAGYKDAYIVDVNKEKKYHDEIISVDQHSIRDTKKRRRKFDFKIQIGAFKEDSIPSNLLKLYLQLEGIEEHEEGELTVLTTGLWKTYEQARKHRDYIKALGIPGPFVTVYERKKKVAVKEAVEYLKKS